MIKGQLTKSETNGYGYTTVWVSGTRYGSDAKGKVQAELGDIVEFDAYDKAGKDGRMWPTFKLQSFKKLDSGSVQPLQQQPAAQVGGNTSTGKYVASTAAFGVGSRDTYWSDKAAEDAKRDPRISYQGAYDRALTFADLALRNGAFAALGKAKDTAKLGILEAFVSEYTDKIMQQTYAATVPTQGPGKVTTMAAGEPDTIGDGESETQWS